MADINNKAVNIAGLKAVYNDLVDKIKNINIGPVYKPCGSVKFADLPEPSAETLGYVYNIEDNFSTNDKFVEGSGKDISAGMNVAIVYIKTITNKETGAYVESYKYDLLGASEITDITINPDIETSLGNISNRRIVHSETANSLYWTDPDDSANGDTWGKTVIVKKKYSYPESIEDGTIVLNCAVKNKFKTVPYIDKQEDAANWCYRAFPISTNGGISNSALNKFGYWHYAVCIDEDNPIESQSVTYLKGYDNEGYKPLKVIMSNDNSNIDDNRCDWGDWKDAPFMPRPCMLKYDGTVDYYLNPDDYTLKENGEASDISNTAYEGNAMMEFSPIFVKAKRVVTPASEDGQTPESSKLYLYFCSHKDDDDYECYSCLKEDGTYADHFYMSIYEATDVDGKFRSLSLGRVPTTSLSDGLRTCLDLAKQNGERWCIDLWSDADLLRCLFILITKRLNSRAAIGCGCTPGNCCVTGSSNKKGIFWGTELAQTQYGTKYFGIENFWGHNYHYCAGILSPDRATFHVKNTYSIADGTTVVGYNDTGEGYIKTGIRCQEESGYVNKISGEKGLITMPVAVDGSDTTYYTDFYSRVSYGGFFLGGSYPRQTGIFYVRSSTSSDFCGSLFGARLSYKGY